MKNNERPRGRRIERAAVATGVAICALHFANGATEPSFTPHWPQLQRALGLDDGQLGIILGFLPIGLVLGGAAAGRLLGRVSSRAVIVVGAVLFWGALPFVGAATSALWWATALLVLGIGNGMFDVAWQLVSTRFERGRARRYHVLVQALFSGGSLVGAALAGVALAGHVSPIRHLGVFAAAALLLAIAAVLMLPRADATAAAEAKLHAPLSGRTPLRSVRLWLLAVVVMASMLPLGTVYVWSTPYLQRLGADGGAATLGLTAFAAAQVVGQVVVGLLPRAWRLADPRALSALGAGIAVVGAVLVVGTSSVAPATAGFALVGLGMAPFPSLPQSVAAELFGHHPQAASVLTIASYGGVLAAPTVFGVLSNTFGLRLALAVLVPLTMGIALVMPSLLSESVRRRRRAS